MSLTQSQLTMAVVSMTTVPDGQIWSVPVWNGQQIVVTYARQQELWARRYDRQLNVVGGAVRITSAVDPDVTDHKHIFLGSNHFVAFSTPGNSDLYLLKLDWNLDRIRLVPVVKGTTRERTNDMLLATDGQRLVVGRFCPCKETGAGHVLTVFDQNLTQVGEEVDLLEPRHHNMASITFGNGAYHILSFARPKASTPNTPSDLLQLDFDPTTLLALDEGSIVKHHDSIFYHATTGLVYDSSRDVYYGSYVRGPDMWGSGTVVVEAFDSQSWQSITSIDVAKGNRPHLTLVDNETLVIGWDEPGVNLGVIRLGTAPLPRASPRAETSKPQALFTKMPHEVTVEELSDGSYVCRPAGVGPFPVVLYNHGGLGTIVGGDLAGTCRSLAEAGYLARSEKRQETRQLTGHLEEVLAGLKRLRSHPDADASRVGVMGFSRGGLLTLQAAIAQPENIHAVVLMAPAQGKSAMERTLRQVSPIDDPVRVFVSENDQTQANHVQISHDVEDALSAAGKDVDLTIYPPYGDDGHKLFFLVQEPYWSDLIAFFDEVFGQE